LLILVARFFSIKPFLHKIWATKGTKSTKEKSSAFSLRAAGEQAKA